MIELRKLLQAYLKTIHPRVFFQTAPEPQSYPYLVIDFPNLYDDGESSSMVTVDIDGWDAPADGDTTALETMMAVVNGNGDIVNPTGLNKRTLASDTLKASFYLDRKIPLTDPDPRIRRRKYVYQVRVFERS